MSKIQKTISVASFASVLAFAVVPAHAQKSVDDLSKAAANPVSPLISLPLQNDFDFGGGFNNSGFAYTLQAQPVIPFALNENWNVISRTLIPLAYNNYSPNGNDFGLGDIEASFYFSPTQSDDSGIIWGIGPVLLLPTATNSNLGAGKWGAGPTAVALIQKGPWTAGSLVSHVWSFAGNSNRSDVNMSLIEPFVSYDFGGGTSLNLSAEVNYDWVDRQWTAPINLSVSQIFQIGEQAMSLDVGGKYYATGPAGSPDWGIRTSLTFFFPE